MKITYCADRWLREDVYLLTADVDTLPRVGDLINHQAQHTEQSPESEGLDGYQWVCLYGVVKSIKHYTATAYETDWAPTSRHEIEVSVAVSEWHFQDVGSESEMYWDPSEMDEPYNRKVRDGILEAKRASKANGD